MKNTYEIKKGSKGYVFIRGKKYTWTSAAEEFRNRMYRTFEAMQNGEVSHTVKLTIEEVSNPRKVLRG